MSRNCPRLAVLILAAFSNTGIAQAETAQRQANYELHFWPSEGMKSVFHSVSDGIYVSFMGITGERSDRRRLADEKDIKVHKAQVTMPLSTEDQIRLTSQIDIPAILRLPDHRLIVHDQALDSQTIRTTKTRLEPASAECYAELGIADVYFQKAFSHGSVLKTFFRFKNFGEGETAQTSFGSWVETKLQVFPPKSPKQDDESLANIHSAFRENFRAFSDALNRPTRNE